PLLSPLFPYTTLFRSIGFGFLSIVRWAALRLFVQLRVSTAVLVRAVPLLLFFSLVIFFTIETWEIFTATGWATYWTAMAIFLLRSEEHTSELQSRFDL